MHIDWGKFAAIAKLATPIVMALVPGDEQTKEIIATSIVDGVTEAQQLPNATDPDKKLHVINIVRDGVAAANAKGAKLDEATTLAAASSAIDTTVGIIKVVHTNHPGDTLPGAVAPAAG